jgi:uncharacterized repeat protein (TIGR03843 family)
MDEPDAVPDLEVTATLDAHEVVRVLACGDLEVLGRMPDASNVTLGVQATLDDVTLAGVYKPRRGERPLWDFPEGTLCQRETAAYVLSALAGWEVVPPTVLRDGPLGPGSVQLYVDHDPTEHYFTLSAAGNAGLRRNDLFEVRGGYPKPHAGAAAFDAEFRVLAAFDVLANNADRKGGHCLLGSDGRIHAIDNGLTFLPEPKLRTVLWDFAGEALPAAVREGLDRIAAALPDNPFGGLLDEEETDALAARVARLTRLNRYPEPRGGYRAYPWPPV